MTTEQSPCAASRGGACAIREPGWVLAFEDRIGACRSLLREARRLHRSAPRDPQWLGLVSRIDELLDELDAMLRSREATADPASCVRAAWVRSEREMLGGPVPRLS